MFNLFFLLVFLNAFPRNAVEKFQVSIELLQPANRDELKVKAVVRNQSNKTVNVLTSRYLDYKREKIRALGNYVIEVQKYENDQYSLFTPSSDIDFITEPEEFQPFPNAESIVDTIHINGWSFSRRGEPKNGFPTGKYRLRLYFNLDRWRCNETNSSNWIEFKIE